MKRIALCIVICLMVFLASGCNSNAFTETPIPATPTAGPTPTRVPPTATPLPEITVNSTDLNGLQIHFMHPWSGDLQLEIDKMIDEFNQSNQWGIHVIADEPGSAGMLTETLSENIGKENQPDLAAMPIQELLKIQQSKKVVIDLNPYLYSSQWGMTAQQISDFMPVFWEQDEINGYRYAVPAERTAAVLIYNQTWAQELGYSTPPTTPEEFQQQICAANQSMKKDNDPANDGLGGWIVSTDGLTTLSWLKTFNTPIYQLGTYQFNTPAAQSTFEYLLSQLSSRCAWISRVPSAYDYFSTRQVMVYSGYMQDLIPQQRAMTAAGSTDQWAITAYPAAKSAAVMAEGPSYAVFSSTPEKQLAAWLFIRWMSTPDHQMRIVAKSSTLPLSAGVLPLLTDFRASLPQWNAIINLLPQIQTPPADANWGYANTVLEDSSWQLFKSGMKSEQIPDLLAQMDSMLQELIERQP